MGLKGFVKNVVTVPQNIQQPVFQPKISHLSTCCQTSDSNSGDGLDKDAPIKSGRKWLHLLMNSLIHVSCCETLEELKIISTVAFYQLKLFTETSHH